MIITLNRNELLAALLFDSDDEDRFLLCGVKVEAKEDALPILIATNGRRLAVIESTADADNLPDDSGEFILRADFIKPICALSKARGGKLFPWIKIETKPGSKQVVAELMGCGLVVRAEDNALIEGNYPNWRDVIPDKKTEITPLKDVALNALYVGDFAKAAKLLSDRPPLIKMGFTTADGVIQVRIDTVPNFYAAVMPCKNESPTTFQPQFLNL